MGKKSKIEKKSGSNGVEVLNKTEGEETTIMSSEDVMALIEKHVGATLLTGPNEPPKPTSSLLKNTDSVILYFGASW
jgi:hypothetical protein